LLLNRKILAQIALLNRNCLYMISNDILNKINKNKEIGNKPIDFVT
jgi:hypothetical protein